MRRQSGFAYLFLLFVLALLVISSLAIGSLQHYARIRSDEAELLRIGAEFRRALSSYRDAATPHVFPKSMDELLLDQRSGTNKRHLRKVYVDPITSRGEWGLVMEHGRIVGIHSLSERVPMKISGFGRENSEFEGVERYSEWVFRAELSMGIRADRGGDQSQRATSP